jgi:hypothetical protein
MNFEACYPSVEVMPPPGLQLVFKASIRKQQASSYASCGAVASDHEL